MTRRLLLLVVTSVACGAPTDNAAEPEKQAAIEDSSSPPEAQEDCTDGLDNDLDGLTDCDDPDCATECTEDCSDGRDNDLDGLTDCDDPDCATECTEDCSDGLDNDLDGLTDCDDPDCATECTEDCSDGRDNDLDGLVDCEDAECAAVCTEDCTDGLDNDLDGFTDCDDVDCSGVGTCPVILWSRARVLGGTGVFHSAETRHHRGTYGGMSHGWDFYTHASFAGSVQLDSVWGTVQVISAARSWATTSATTCTWSASNVRASGSFGSPWRGPVHSWGITRSPGYGFLYAGAHHRSGVRTSGACALVGSGFLPSVLAPWNGAVFRRGLSSVGPAPQSVVYVTGGHWYGGTTLWSSSALGSTLLSSHHTALTWTRSMSVELAPGGVVHEALNR
jgi:hypothetical protein